MKEEKRKLNKNLEKNLYVKVNFEKIISKNILKLMSH